MSLKILISSLSFIVGFLLAFVLISHVLKQKRAASGTIAWLMVIFFMPYLGVPLYLLFGGRKMRRTAMKKGHIGLFDIDVIDPLECCEMDSMLRNYGIPGATRNNHLSICSSSSLAYSKLLKLIEESNVAIYISTFILHPDQTGREVIQKLSEKAAQGVEVKLLLDSFGSMFTKRKFLEPLKKSGGDFHYFMPMLHWPLRGKSNLRNHRKIAIFDFTTVMSGGNNIATEYLGSKPSKSRWKDMSFIVDGAAARHYLEIFRQDWSFACGKELVLENQQTINPIQYQNGSDIQVVPSGPDVDGDPLYSSILTLIFQAKERIWIVTPYFVPDEALQEALMIAAHRHVDVRILVPAKSNHLMADLVRGSYLRDLKNAGALIQLYQPGMMHAKILIKDQDVAILGSANMDMRSLFLNYESALMVYDQKKIDEVQQWIDKLASQSRIGGEAVSFGRDLIEHGLKIASPLL